MQNENKMKWHYFDLVHSLRQLLPVKLYKITYEYFKNGAWKREIKLIEAYHYHEAKIDITYRLNINSDEINFLEIQQIAS